MFKKITLMSMLALIFAMGSLTVTSCKKRNKHKKWKKRNKRNKRRRKEEKKRERKERKKACNKLYKKIISSTSYTKKDIKAVFNDKKGFIRTCKANQELKPWRKLIKCRNSHESFQKCSKKYLKKLFKNKIKKGKIKKVKSSGNASGELKLEDAKKSAKSTAFFAFKAAKKGDFEKLNKIVLTKEEAKDFDKGNLFNKYANPKKLKEKFEKWKTFFLGAEFKKIKPKDEEKFNIAPGSKVKKFEELGAAVKKEVTVWSLNIKAEKDGKTAKCAVVTIKLADKDWRVIRLKGCKWK
jgi:hypothetical protein